LDPSFFAEISTKTDSAIKKGSKHVVYFIRLYLDPFGLKIPRREFRDRSRKERSDAGTRIEYGNPAPSIREHGSHKTRDGQRSHELGALYLCFRD
jgi:hypothetical protein